MKIKIKEIGATPGLLKKQIKPILKKGYKDIGDHWHQKMRPKHFTREGAREYGYTPRKGEAGSGKAFKSSYTGAKHRRFGHTLPLVFSGVSRQLSRLRDVRATSRGVRIVMTIPAFNFKPKNSSIDMRQEMSRVSIRERNTIIRVMDRSLDNNINRLRTQKTTRA